MKLQGKIIVVTGASSGIGKQFALQVAQNGATPILLARNEEKLKILKEEIISQCSVPCYYYVLDVCQEKMVEDVFSRLSREVGDVDVLVNNAGFGLFETVTAASLQDVKAMFDVNVFGLVSCTKAVLPHMIKRNSGHIINVASFAGKIATPKSSAYSATKHAVLGFTNSLRMELAGTNVHVTAVNPGPIETNFLKIADKSGTYINQVKRYILKPDYVAAQIIKIIGTKQREVNLPRWMSVGPIVFALFPRLFERLARKTLSKK